MTDSDLFEQIETQNPEAVKELADGKLNTMEHKEEITPPTIIPIEVPTPKGFIKLHIDFDGRPFIFNIAHIVLYSKRPEIDRGSHLSVLHCEGEFLIRELPDQISAQIMKQML